MLRLYMSSQIVILENSWWTLKVGPEAPNLTLWLLVPNESGDLLAILFSESWFSSANLAFHATPLSAYASVFHNLLDFSGLFRSNYCHLTRSCLLLHQLSNNWNSISVSCLTWLGNLFEKQDSNNLQVRKKGAYFIVFWQLLALWSSLLSPPLEKTLQIYHPKPEPG